MKLSTLLTLTIVTIVLLSSIHSVQALEYYDSFYNVTPNGNGQGDIKFNLDGTKMFILDTQNTEVDEYNCDSFDILTCIYAGNNERFGVNPFELTPTGFAFNTSGTLFVTVGSSGVGVQYFTCIAPFDVSSCVNSASGTLDISSESTDPSGVAFNDNGSRLYVVDRSVNEIFQYDCSTNYLPSSCDFSANSKSLIITSEETRAGGLTFNNIGTKLYVVGYDSDIIFEYACSEAFAIDTCTLRVFEDLSSILNDPSGVVFNDDGTKVFFLSSSNARVYEYSLPTAFDITSVPNSPSLTATTGSSANKHLTRPTFGLDHNTFNVVVENAFSYNLKFYSITDNYYTPFDEQIITVGEYSVFTAKVLSERDLRVQEFLFGIPEVGKAHQAELGIEVHYTKDGVIEKVFVVQQSKIVDMETLTVSTHKSKCLTNDTESKCISTVLIVMFLEPLEHKILALKAIDHSARTQITYFNEGISITGTSLNEMNTMLIAGPEKYEGLISVTKSSKFSDIWLSEDDREFQRNAFGTFTQINKPLKISFDDSDHIKNRTHSMFHMSVGIEHYKASLVLNNLCKRCTDEAFDNINDIFAYDYPETVSKSKDPKLAILLQSEIERAEDVIYDLKYPILIYK